MQDIATRLAHRAVDANQIGIIVGGHAHRVERTLAGAGRRGQRRQRRTRQQQRRGRENERAARQAVPCHVMNARHGILLRNRRKPSSDAMVWEGFLKSRMFTNSTPFFPTV